VTTITCIALVLTLLIPAVALLAYSIGAIRDLATGARLGSTFKRWLRRVADAFFSVA
jgi:hypothetical protein